MGNRCYVGTTEPARPAIVRARYVHFGGYPSALIPQLRGVWACHTRRDTSALIDAILAHDWFYLGSHVIPGTPSFPGQHPVAGVGVTLDDTFLEPATVFPLSRAIDLGVSWIYLINPADDTVTVHSGDGDRVGVHPLGYPLGQENVPAMPSPAPCLVPREATAGRATAPRSRRTCHLDTRRRPG